MAKEKFCIKRHTPNSLENNKNYSMLASTKFAELLVGRLKTRSFLHLFKKFE